MYRTSSSANKGKVTNVGATASRLAARPQTLHSTAGIDFEDRYRRTAEENTQLKKERNELEEKLKECKTKLRRLTRDLMVSSGGSGGVDAGHNISAASSTVMTDEARKGPSSPNSNGGRSGPPRATGIGAAGSANREDAPQNAATAPSFHQPQHIAPSFSTIHTSLLEQEKKRLEESLQRAKAQIEYMQSEMIKIQKSAPPAEQNAMHLATQIQLLHQQLDNARTTKESDERRIVELQRERDVVHSDLSTITSQLKQSDQCRAVLQQQLTEALAALANATTNNNGAVYAQQQQQARSTGLASFELGSDFYKRQVSELMGQLQTMRDQQLQDQHTIETAIRERDAARIQLGRARAAAAGAGINLSGAELSGEVGVGAARGSEGGGSGAFDAASMHELQRALAEKSAQILVLTNQVNFAQSRAEATKKESERVLEDLKSIHLQHAEVKRNMFQLEHEKASLILRCEKVPSLEATLELKTQELLKSEHELLKCIDRLQSCSRDTELQVRKEIGDRIAELENMRDKAEADRRACEREVLAVKLEVSDSKRRLENALHDTELYKREVQRLEAEKKEMMDRVALANVTGIAGFSSVGGGQSFNNMGNATVGNGENNNNTNNNNSTLVGAFGLPINLNDDVSRAVALAALRKRAAGATDVGSAMDLKNNNANEVMAMWEGMEWSDGKELSMLRETLAATAVDMELAETRCVQLQQAVADKTKLLEGISSERDELLNENIELRHRISGVQTALARAHLQKISASSALTKSGSKAHSTTTTLVIALNSISCDPILQQRDDGKMYTPTLFFSLELEGMGAGHQYEPVLSETFYALNSQLSVQFVFENIDVEAINFTTIQKASFVLQLHQSFGVESEIVACASLSGARLLHCRYDGVHHDKLQLLSLEGTEIGSVDVTVAAPDLLLPILLGRPIVSAVTPDSIRSALIAYRSVRALRIQVFGASDLYCQAAGGTNSPPSPYVYYTSTSPHGITFIAETMVSPSSRTATANPVFDLVPVDHPVILDPEFVRFMSDGSLSFVVFDHKAVDVQSNLGIAVIQLAEMLTSPTFVLQKRLPLHPQGSLEVGISWVRSAASEY